MTTLKLLTLNNILYANNIDEIAQLVKVNSLLPFPPPRSITQQRTN